MESIDLERMEGGYTQTAVSEGLRRGILQVLVSIRPPPGTLHTISPMSCSG